MHSCLASFFLFLFAGRIIDSTVVFKTNSIMDAEEVHICICIHLIMRLEHRGVGNHAGVQETPDHLVPDLELVLNGRGEP